MTLEKCDSPPILAPVKDGLKLQRHFRVLSLIHNSSFLITRTTSRYLALGVGTCWARLLKGRIAFNLQSNPMEGMIIPILQMEKQVAKDSHGTCPSPQTRRGATWQHTPRQSRAVSTPLSCPPHSSQRAGNGSQQVQSDQPPAASHHM